MEETRKTKLREWCEQQGYERITDECIETALDHEDPTIRAQARFAKNMRWVWPKLRKTGA